MGEEIPMARHDDPAKLGPIPSPIVLEKCLACGRHKGEWLTWGEAERLFGFARTSCLTCLLTDVHRPRVPPDDVPESATIL